MPNIPSNIEELLDLVVQEIIDNTSGLIEEHTLRYVLSQIVKVLDTKISLISPELTEEQLTMWKKIADFKASDFIGTINSGTIFPDAKSWGFAGPGTYSNADDIVIPAGHIAVITFDGSSYSEVALPLPQATQSIVPFSTSTFPLVAPTPPNPPIQRTYDNSIWELKDGQTATITDVPGISGKWVSLNASDVPSLSAINYPSSMPVPSGFFKVKDINLETILIEKKENAFILKIKTDNAGTSSSNQFTFVGVGTYKIDWGDGTIETKTNTATHTYASAGIYTIKVTGGLNYIRYANASDKLKLLSIVNWGVIKWTSFQDAFWGCSNLILQATDYPDLSTVTVFQRIFMDCTNFKGNESMKNWHVSTLTNLQNAFNNSGLATDLSGWVFSKNLTLLNSMFFKTPAIAAGGVPDSDIMNRFIINLANWGYGVAPTGAPLNVNAGGHGKYYTNKIYSDISGQFKNAIDAMAYLTGTLNWTWVESSLSRTVLQDGQFDKGYMVLGVDDGYVSWNTLFEPKVLAPRNIKATFFVSQAYIDVPTQPTYTNWANIKALYDKGHNIENHTWEHLNLAGTGFTEKRTRDGIDKVDAKLAENGMPQSLHVSYPFGGHTDNTKKWLRRDTFLKTGRMTRINPSGGPAPEFDGLITTKVDKFAIPCEPFTGTMTNGKLERFKMLLDQAKAEKKALVVYAHEFTENDAAVINDNWITIALAQAICDYCISIGVEIITHDKLYNLLDPNTI